MTPIGFSEFWAESAGGLTRATRMAAFFLVQGLLVVATSRSRSFRRLAKRAPLLTWALTLLSMLTTGVMLVRGADGVDPSDAWRRCCRTSTSSETLSGPM